MSTAKLTLIGLYNNDSTLFDNLSVPTGIDKSTLTNNILLKGGEFEVLYSNPEFMKFAIGAWSNKWQHTMLRWVKLLNVDYDPLNNYDRHEKYTDTTSNTGSENTTANGTNNTESSNTNNTTNSGTNSVTNTGTATDTSSNTFSGTTEGKVSAFDSSEYQPHDHTAADNTTSATVSNTSNSTSESTNSSTVGETGTENIEATTSNTSNTSKTDAGSLVHDAYMFGNIGVTSSQELYEAEVSVLKINMYDELSELFLAEFVIPVYD